MGSRLARVAMLALALPTELGVGACKAELGDDQTSFIIDSAGSGEDALPIDGSIPPDVAAVADASPDARVCAGGAAHAASATTCFFRVDTPSTFLDAEAGCEVAGAKLAIILNQADQTAAAVGLGGTEDLFIGLNDRQTEGVYEWPDSTLLGMFRAYATDEPNDGGGAGENCSVLAFTAMRQGRWDDRPCDGVSGTYAYICSFPL